MPKFIEFVKTDFAKGITIRFGKYMATFSIINTDLLIKMTNASGGFDNLTKHQHEKYHHEG